jgi:hypothetical protein
MTKSKDVVKGVAKQALPPSKNNVDPSDPWSATGAGGGIQIPENVTSRRSELLKRYYKSIGYNINYITKNQRVGKAKTGEFEKWKRDHGIYEDEEVNEDLTTKYNGKHVGAPDIRSDVSKSPTLRRQRHLNAASHHYAIPTPAGSMKYTTVKKEDVGDSLAATQSPADGANGGNEEAPKKSKAIKMVKEIYAKHRLKEDLYDHEKDDKGPGTNTKLPKVIKKVEVNDENDKGTNARMVLKGGTTMTGEKRDTIEIDPMMKNRSKQPDYIATNTGKKSNQ